MCSNSMRRMHHHLPRSQCDVCFWPRPRTERIGFALDNFAQLQRSLPPRWSFFVSPSFWLHPSQCLGSDGKAAGRGIQVSMLLQETGSFLLLVAMPLFLCYSMKPWLVVLGASLLRYYRRCVFHTHAEGRRAHTQGSADMH